MRCSGRAGCRPGQTDHGERGKRPARAGLLVAARRGAMSAEACGAWRSSRIRSPRAGKPSTWRRRTAGPQHETPFGRSGVNTPAPLPAVELAQERVLGWQTKLHRWAAEDRAAALRRSVQPPLRPRDPPGRVGAGETQPGVEDRRCRWSDAQADRGAGRGERSGRAQAGAQGRLLCPAAGARAQDPQARVREGQKARHSRPARPDRPDGGHARARADLRDGLLSDLVWVSAGAQGAGRDRGSAALHQPTRLL